MHRAATARPEWELLQDGDPPRGHHRPPDRGRHPDRVHDSVPHEPRGGCRLGAGRERHEQDRRLGPCQPHPRDPDHVRQVQPKGRCARRLKVRQVHTNLIGRSHAARKSRRLLKLRATGARDNQSIQVRVTLQVTCDQGSLSARRRHAPQSFVYSFERGRHVPPRGFVVLLCPSSVRVCALLGPFLLIFSAMCGRRSRGSFECSKSAF
mmetsp:Transcript_66571/g.164110  ORF Transcript_66571/g.164110 Transcript_66571/m.164110 type:complete len:208 (-) Transcript_66571:404-1027(-)